MEVVSFINIFVLKIIANFSSIKKSNLVLWPWFGDLVSTWRMEKTFSSLVPKEGMESIART